MQQLEQVAKAKNKYEERAMDADILEIPELEEEGKEDLTRVVSILSGLLLSLSLSLSEYHHARPQPLNC